MAPLSTIPFPTTGGTHDATSHWLDLITQSVQPAVRRQAVDRAARARILEQAAASMLAPVARQPRAVSDLLR
ncbi:hypothetical protein [Telluria beijingensis]|uniref:hypothetical protein n=1 Tax=Telluria beijingensis TaxID=3068633 RepID=UPI00279558FF|nr:hypothetical protein [Massilia sp. REN29]